MSKNREVRASLRRAPQTQAIMQNFSLNQFFDAPKRRTDKQRRGRICRVEELESRELLAVTFGEFEALRNHYAELDLSASMADYNVIEIAEAELSAKALQTALNTAAKTTQDDLIVIRTDAGQSAIDLGNSTLSVDVNSAQFGSVTVVMLGSERVQITSSASAGVLVATNGNVAFGGIILNSTNGSLNIDNVLWTASSVQVVTSYFVKSVERNGSTGNYSVLDDEYTNTADTLSLLSGSPIGSKMYDVDVQMYGTTYAYLVGLSATDYYYILSAPSTWFNNLGILNPYDAEKSNQGDSYMCWAAVSANMLAYTGWGNINGFQTEDDIFAYFVEHFTDDGGHQY
jgi:hypothetical protein